MQGRINVLHVLNSAHGGSALSTFQLIEVLKANQVQSSLVCFNNATEELKTKIRKLVDDRVLFIPLYWTNKRIRVAWWKRPLLEALTVWQTWWGYKYQKQISSLIRQHHIHLIHTSTIVNPEGAIAAEKNNIPHVWHVRELIGPDTYYTFPRFRSWVSYVETHADFLIANSQATFKNLILYFRESKIQCIPNGIALEGYRVKIHRPSETLVVAMVGNVTSRLKNHEFFIKTAAHFRNNTSITFRIYGALPEDNDSYYVNLKELIHQNGLIDTVIFMGHRENAAMVMDEIDVLFHPTGYESFGRIFIEAMAGGIPIVAVDEGGAVELVRNSINGFRVPENNTVAAADALKKMINSVELRNQMGKSGRDIVEREYSLSLLADSILILYKKVVA